MRPSAEQVIRSMRHSLREDVIPRIEDPWARYVAKSLDHMLVHLAARWADEGRFLVEDSTELLALLGTLLPADDPVLAETAPAPYVTPTELTTQNERLRRALETVLENTATGSEPDPAVHDYLRRQVARDSGLAAATEVSFAPRAAGAR
jgi:hypothetical protein